MSSSFFQQGIVTYTFLVNLAQVPEIDEFLLELENADDKLDMPDIKDNPQFWAEGAVQRVFGRIIKKHGLKALFYISLFWTKIRMPLTLPNFGAR
jgi:hypothetical protein